MADFQAKWMTTNAIKPQDRQAASAFEAASCLHLMGCFTFPQINNFNKYI
jgi:hypothetical protein